MSLPPKDLLVPGPWRVKGNTVFDANGRTVCVVFARNATAHAYWIAETPGFASNIGETAESHSSELIELRRKVTSQERTIALLENDISRLEDKLDTLENKGLCDNG